MARGRMINQSVATDKRLNSLSLEAELVYLMAIPHLDRDGLILGDPYMLASQVCPRRPELASQMDTIINQWIELELVIRYEGKEDPVLFFVGFPKNQAGLRYEREAPSQFPTPPGYKRTAAGLVPEEFPEVADIAQADTGQTPAELRHKSRKPPAQWNRKESNTTTPAADEIQPDVVGGGSGGGSSGSSFLQSFSTVERCWKDNMQIAVTPVIRNDLKSLLTDYGESNVCAAIEVAVRANRREMRYVQGVLKRKGTSVNGANGHGEWKLIDDE